MSGLISPRIWVKILVTILKTPHKTTHEPPSRACLRSGAEPETVNPLLTGSYQR